MGRPMPLFPLNTVLFPGVVLPLHVFEERYCQLVRDLVDGSEQTAGAAEIGIVALRHGRETDPSGPGALVDVGCVAQLRQVTELGDGRFHVLSSGTTRFRIRALGPPSPYMRADVDDLADDLGKVEDGLVGAVHQAFERYLDLVSATHQDEVVGTFPDDPLALSYLVAATMALSLPDRQRLLEATDATTRLHAELDLLDREQGLIRTLGALPATDLTRTGFSLN